MSDEHVIGAKAGRNGHHVFQAQPKQRRTRKQNKRERDLRDNKSLAKALSGATDRARAGFRSERILEMAAQVEPRDRHRDDDSQNNRASEASRRQPAIERNARPERQAIRTKNFKQPNSRGAHHKPEQSAKCGEQERLNHHVTHHMPAARAHRSADRHVLHVAARANEKQIDQIDRAHNQKEQRTALHQQKGRTDRAHVIGMEWKHRRAEAGLSHHRRSGIIFLDAGVVRVDL